MSNVEELINALQADKTADANNIFASVMHNKIGDAINDKKIALANQVYNGAVEQEVTDTDSNEDV